MKKLSFLFLVLVLCNGLRAATISCKPAGGAYGVVGTWVGGVVPGKADSVIIVTGATVTATVNDTCAYLNLMGTLNFNTANITLVVLHNFYFNGGSTTTNNANRGLTVLGNMTVLAASSLSGIVFSVAGTSTISNQLTFANNTGNKL